MIFIDGANVFGAIKTINEEIERKNVDLPPEQKINKIKIDYVKLVELLSDSRDKRRTYFFDGKPERSPNNKEYFFNALRKQGITVITRPVRYKTLDCERCKLWKNIHEEAVKKGNAGIKPFNIENGEPIGYPTKFNQEFQKGIDVALVTELLRMAREDVYDTALVVSGDNDYKNAIECVKSMGKRVEVASFRSALGDDLKEVADKLIFLDDYITSIRQ